MAHLIAESKLVNCSCRVAAADNGSSVCLSQGFGNCDSAFCKNRVLEYAHRSVPYNCLGCLGSFCVCFCSLRSDIQSESVCRDSVTVYIIHIDLCVDGVRERFRDSCICWKKKLFSKRFCLCDHFLAVVKLGIVYQGSAYFHSFCFQEGISHAAADDQSVAFLQKVGDYVQLVSNFCAAKNRYERSYRCLNSFTKEIDFFLHQISNHAGIDILSYAYVGAVRSVGGSERVVHEYVCQRSKFLAELFAVLGLFRAITCILKKNDLAVLHSFYSLSYLVVNNNRACNEFHFLSEKLGKTYCNRCKRKFGFRLSLRFAKMRAEDYSSAVCNEFLNGRKSCNKTVLVCDLSFFQRNVEIASYKNFLSLYVDIVN